MFAFQAKRRAQVSAISTFHLFESVPGIHPATSTYMSLDRIASYGSLTAREAGKYIFLVGHTISKSAGILILRKKKRVNG